MWQASWMSLGIIVTLFAWIAQRLVSSRSPTRYASTASCRHKMAHACNHKSYLPTSRAISLTSHEKGIFQIRSPVLFWNWQISQRATVPSWYFWGFFTWPALRNSFWGVLPPMVGLCFLLAGSSPTQCRWPGLCSHLGQLLGQRQLWWPPHISQPLCLCDPPVNSSWSGGVSCAGAGVSTSAGGLWASACTCTLVWTSCSFNTGGSTTARASCIFAWAWAHVFTLFSLLTYPLCGVTFIFAMLKVRKRESANQKPEQSHESCGIHFEFLIIMVTCISFTNNRIIEIWQMSGTNIRGFWIGKTRS